MVRLMLFDIQENYIGRIKNIISATQSIEVSGKDTLDIQAKDNRIRKGYRILYHDEKIGKFYEYIVQEFEEYKEGNSIIVDAYCENSIVETMCDFIEKEVANNVTASDAVELILKHSRWDKHYVQNSESANLNLFRINVRTALSEVVETWGLEMQTFITWDSYNKKIGRSVGFVEEVGSKKGERLTYDSNILEIKRKTLSKDVITALYGFGKPRKLKDGKNGPRLDFGSINKGKKYIQDDEALQKYGRISNGKRINNFASVEFDAVEDKKVLYKRTLKELKKMNKPSVSYDVKMFDYFRLSGSKRDYISIGDYVKVLDRDFKPQLNFTLRVVSIEKDLVNLENTSITLGEFVKDITDSDSEVDKKIEDANKQLPDYGDDGEDGGGSGTLPEYVTASDLIKANPSIKLGLSSWVDVNEDYAVDYGEGKTVSSVRDALTKNVVYSQDDSARAPVTKNVNGRRYLSFEPDPMTLVKWPIGGERPKDAIKQNGKYLNYHFPDDNIKHFLIVYIDRTDLPQTSEDPKLISEGRVRRGSAEDFYRVGSSCPIGDPFIYPATRETVGHDGSTRYNDLYDGTFISSDYDFKKDEYVNEKVQDLIRARGSVRAVSRPTKLTTSINVKNLGMNKRDYGDILYSSVNAEWGKHPEPPTTYYELNGFFKGEIAEIVLFKRELSQVEIEIMSNYFKNKYECGNINHSQFWKYRP